MIILDIVWGLLYFLATACYYFLALSYHTGRLIVWIVCGAVHFVCVVCTAFAIIGEEFCRFLGILYENVLALCNDVRSNTNDGIESVLEALTLFCTHMIQFFINTKMYCKLLATTCGQCIVAVFELIRDSMLLIGDWFWWLVTFLPKTLTCCLIAIGDFLVLVVSSTMLLLTNLVHNVIADVFRYTIAVVVIILMSKNFSRLCALLRECFSKIKLFFRIIMRLFLGLHITLRPRNVHHNVSRGEMNLGRSSNDTHQSIRVATTRNTTDKVHESQQCVACCDQAKRVLLLPCKHLCLCEDCAHYLWNMAAGRAQCPLCRTEIVQSVSVYL